MELFSSVRAAIVSLNKKEISHLAQNDDSRKRIGTEEKHTFFVTLNGQEIRHLEELAYGDQAAQGIDGWRGHCSWWWLGVTL